MKCIQSILGQTFNDYEIILVDDLSIDSSNVIAGKYAEKEAKLKLIQNTNNLGVSYSRNNGLKIANGKFIVFVDSDDTLNTDALSKIYKTVINNNHPDLVVFGFGGSSDEANMGKYFNELTDINSAFKIINEIQYYIGYCWRFAYNNKIIKECDILFRDVIIHEDALFTSEYLLACKKVTGISDKIYNKGRSNSGLSSARDINATISCLRVAYLLQKTYSDNLDYEKKTYIIGRIKFIISHFLPRIINTATDELISIAKYIDVTNINKHLKDRITLFRLIVDWGPEGILHLRKTFYDHLHQVILKHPFRKVVVFCGGLFGESVVDGLLQLDVEVHALIDNSPLYLNSEYRGISYKTIRVLKDKANILVLICNQRDAHYLEILKQVSEINPKARIERIKF